MSATTKTWLNSNPPTAEDVDLNGFKAENNNLIIGSGQTLNTGDNQQTHKAVAHYSAAGDYYVDSGAVNTYVLGVTGVQVAPAVYATGMRIRFFAGNVNTGASTVNVAGLGVVSLVSDKTSNPLLPGEISDSNITEAYYIFGGFRVVSSPILVMTGVGNTTVSTTLTSTLTSIGVVDFGKVTTGERVVLSMRAVGTKGATAGAIQHAVVKDVAGVSFSFATSATVEDETYVAASSTYKLSASFTFVIIGTGSLILDFKAASQGSNATSAVLTSSVNLNRYS